MLEFLFISFRAAKHEILESFSDTIVVVLKFKFISLFYFSSFNWLYLSHANAANHLVLRLCWWIASCYWIQIVFLSVCLEICNRIHLTPRSCNCGCSYIIINCIWTRNQIVNRICWYDFCVKLIIDIPHTFFQRGVVIVIRCIYDINSSLRNRWTCSRSEQLQRSRVVQEWFLRFHFIVELIPHSHPVIRSIFSRWYYNRWSRWWDPATNIICRSRW